jgi:hypothetical protein
MAVDRQRSSRAPAAESENLKHAEVPEDLNATSKSSEIAALEERPTPSEDDLATLKSINIKRSEEIASKKLSRSPFAPFTMGKFN